MKIDKILTNIDRYFYYYRPMALSRGELEDLSNTISLCTFQETVELHRALLYRCKKNRDFIIYLRKTETLDSHTILLRLCKKLITAKFWERIKFFYEEFADEKIQEEKILNFILPLDQAILHLVTINDYKANEYYQLRTLQITTGILNVFRKVRQSAPVR